MIGSIRLNRWLDALIVVAICVVGGVPLVREWSGQKPEEAWRDASPLLRPGRAFSVAGLPKDRRHLLVGIQTTCPACNADRPFYKRLAEEVSNRNDIDMTVLSAQPVGDVVAWLSADSVAPNGRVVKVRSFAKSGFVYTPTVFITSADGVVADFVTGELTPEEEEALLGRVRAPDLPPFSKDPFAAEVSSPVRGPSGAQVLDVRGRVAFRKRPASSAIHIPFDELNVRSRAELKMGEPVVIDCTREDWGYCRLAGAELLAIGFENVTIIFPGQRPDASKNW